MHCASMFEYASHWHVWLTCEVPRLHHVCTNLLLQTWKHTRTHTHGHTHTCAPVYCLHVVHVDGLAQGPSGCFTLIHLPTYLRDANSHLEGPAIMMSVPSMGISRLCLPFLPCLPPRMMPHHSFPHPWCMQVWVGVLAQGPSGHSLCSNYQSRDNLEWVARVARVAELQLPFQGHRMQSEGPD